MTDNELQELKKVAAQFFTTIVLIHCRELYRDELSDEMRRINSELEELNDKLLADTKEIGAFVLKLCCNRTDKED